MPPDANDESLEFVKSRDSFVQFCHDNVPKETMKNCVKEVHAMYPEDMMAKEAFTCLRKAEEIKKKVELDFEKKMRAIYFDHVPPPLSYEDSDQSPLRGLLKMSRTDEDSMFLSAQSDHDLDYQPANPLLIHRGHLSSWLHCIWIGDYELFMQHLAGKSDVDVTMLLKRRESFKNVGALFHVIKGLKDSFVFKNSRLKNGQYVQFKNGYIEILEKLLSLGAEVNARDFAGNTPLHWCLWYRNSTEGKDLTLKFAEKLLRSGADINARNRLGNTILTMCMTTHNVEFAKFLLSKGADPEIPDNDGIKPENLAKLTDPAMRNLLGAKEAVKATASRQEAHAQAGGNFKQCQVCKSYARDTKRCTGCYLVWYCNPACQKENWGDHKQECKKARKDYVPVIIQLKFEAGIDPLTGEAYSNIGKENKPTKGHFIVKIQSAEETRSLEEALLSNCGLRIADDPMMIYNKDKSLYGTVERVGNEGVFHQLTRKIKEEGFKESKGYFYAIFESNKIEVEKCEKGNKNKEKTDEKMEKEKSDKLEILINSATILPVEEW